MNECRMSPIKSWRTATFVLKIEPAVRQNCADAEAQFVCMSYENDTRIRRLRSQLQDQIAACIGHRVRPGRKHPCNRLTRHLLLTADAVCQRQNLKNSLGRRH